MLRLSRALALGLGLALTWTPQVRAEDPVDWDTEVRNLFHDAGISAGAVAILRGGEHTHSVYVGTRDHAPDGPALDADSVHVAASLGKPVFAWLALQCVDDGLLDLDTPLAELAPNPRLAGQPGADAITPRMVLSHTSGLPNWSGAQLQLIDTPGAAWHDSGEGYLWLQQALERITGRPLQELARERLFAPLGMDASGFIWRESMGDRLVSGRSSFGLTRRIGRIGTANAAGTLLTTLDDMARFVAASLRGTGLSPELYAEALTSQVALVEMTARAPVDLGWGLGWGLAHDGRREALWQWGDAGDFTSWVLAWRDTGDALVLLCNDAEGLSVAGSLGRLLRDVPQIAPEHLDYEPWDAPDRMLRRRLLTSFRRSVAAGRRAWDELRDEFAPDDRLEHLRRAGFTLLFEGRETEALALLELTVAAHADEPLAHVSMADAASHVRDWARATRAFEEALALEPSNEVTSRRLGWVRAERDAPPTPRPLDPVQAGRLVGRYGEHTIAPHAGGLRWSRPGVQGHDLVPLGDGVYRLDGLPGLHLRFVLSGPGPATALRAESGSGRLELHPRTP